MDEIEFSESGTPILRYEAIEPHVPDGGDLPDIEAISAHIERHIGPIEMVWHEILSDLVHIDVMHVAPNKERPFHTLITCGMSARPMNVPLEIADQFGDIDPRFAELMICLPADWPLSQKAFGNPCHFWPVEWLKRLARFPHEYQTWFFEGHTMPNGDPARPFSPDTQLCCMMLVPPLRVPAEFRVLRGEDRAINFFAMMPLYQSEIDFKLKNGGEALLDLCDEHNVDELLDIHRAAVVPTAPKRRWFGR